MPLLKREARSKSLKALAFFRFSAAHLLPFVTLGYIKDRLVLRFGLPIIFLSISVCSLAVPAPLVTPSATVGHL